MNTGAAPSLGTPAAEVTIDAALVAGLLAEQHPDLARLPLYEVDAGWDNAMFRLGDRLALRLPRRAAAAHLIAHEQDWLPQLAARLTLPIPTPQRIGMPGRGYPWRWSVLPWLPGQTADQQEPAATEARPFAAFLRSLHVAAPADAPHNPVRGGALQPREVAIKERMQRLATKTSLITPELRRVWDVALQAEIDVPPTWVHGDLHPRNVLIQDGVISGVIDWGDITAGDPATDLAAIWMLFGDRAARREALESYGELSEATIQRARGWAVVLGSLLLDTGLIDHPRHALLGERALRRVAEPL